jgi:hypothetical protein
LPKSRPRGDTAALVIMTLPDEATVVSSMWPTILQRRPGLDTCVAAAPLHRDDQGEIDKAATKRLPKLRRG